MHNEVLLRPVEDSWCESCTGNITEEETWCNAAVQTNKGTQIASNCQVNQVNLPKASVALAFAACALHIQLFRSKPWGNKRMNWSGHNIHDTICLPIFCILLILQFLRLSHICTLPKTWIIGNLLWHNQTLWQDWIVCTGFAILMLSMRKVQAGQGTSDICLGPASFTLSDQTRPEAKCVSRDRSRKVRTN